MVKFAVYAKVRADRENEFLAALREYLPTVSAEPGTVQYDVCRANDDSSTFLFFEAYHDETGSRAHTGSAAFKAYIETIKPLLESPPVAMSLIESAKG
jgi:quinol monooxygenase YgiN